MNWRQYGTGDSVTVEQVENIARSLEEQELQEYSTMWFEVVRRMRAAEIIYAEMGVGAEIELPNGINIYLENGRNN